jgi:hypothetical protein
LWGPHPVILSKSRDFNVLPVDDIGMPLDTREVDTPLVSFARGRSTAGDFAESLPRHCDLDTPAFVYIRRVVQSAVSVNGSF